MRWLACCALAACDPFHTGFDDLERAEVYHARGERSPPAQPERLRVMTYNVKFGGGRIDFFFDCHGDRVLMRRGVQVTLQVYVVDTESGQQLGACEATGTEDKLVEIQNDVGLELVRTLKVPITKAEVDKVLTARTNVDLHAAEGAQVAHRESVVKLPRADTARSRGMDAMEKAIAKEDAKIIAKASARALRRGLH